MNLALVYCWKEWRAQRGILVAYMLLVFVCLTIGFTLVPEHWWLEDGRGALSLSWFVAAGVIGVVAFVAPALVRAEYGPKDDQFVRRLPGALGPSFRGKLLFLVLAAAALPLLGLLVGEGFLTTSGKSWADLWTTRWGLVGWEANEVHVVLQWPWTVPACGVAMLLVPWVWAIGTWLPAGRMALGGAVLFVLLLGVVLFAVSRQCPQIESGLAAWPWLVFATVLAFVVAGASWAKGRRGGGATRSAKVGLLTFGAAVLPPGLWLGDRVHDYLRPDLETVLVQNVIGLTPDHHYALAYGAKDPNWPGVPLRIDLQTGVAQQLGGYRDTYTGTLTPPWNQRQVCIGRFLRTHGEDLGRQSLFDLANGTVVPIGYDEKTSQPVLPARLEEVVARDLLQSATCREPGGLGVFGMDGKLCFEEADGSRTSMPWSMADYYCGIAGHGLVLRGKQDEFFDLMHRKHFELKGHWSGIAVRGIWLLTPHQGKSGRQRYEVTTGQMQPLDELVRCRFLGLFDDDHVLCSRDSKDAAGGHVELLLYRPADRSVISLATGLPEASCQFAVYELGRWGSLVSRDPEGRIWLTDGVDAAQCVVVSANRTVTVRSPRWGGRVWNRVLAWTGHDRLMAADDGKIFEQDLNTGERTVLFPRRAQ